MQEFSQTDEDMDDSDIEEEVCQELRPKRVPTGLNTAHVFCPCSYITGIRGRASAERRELFRTDAGNWEKESACSL